MASITTMGISAKNAGQDRNMRGLADSEVRARGLTSVVWLQLFRQAGANSESSEENACAL